MCKILKIINSRENDYLKFKPSNDFYKRMEISKKRFWQIVRGEKSGTIDELKKIAKVFKVEVTEII